MNRDLAPGHLGLPLYPERQPRPSWSRTRSTTARSHRESPPLPVVCGRAPGAAIMRLRARGPG